MAWTGSTPHRGVVSFATGLVTGLGHSPWSRLAISCQALLQRTEATLRTNPFRTSIASNAVVLACAGSLAPLVAAETFASLLFAGAAGLTCLALARPASATPRQSKTASRVVERRLSRGPERLSPDLKRRGSIFSDREIALARLPAHSNRFSELTTPATPSPVDDRARWAKLTAHMSHELRTPLNAVLGFSEMMTNEVCGPMGSHCYSDYARSIHASGRMLLKSAEDALAITALLTATDARRNPVRACLKSAVADAVQFHGTSFSSCHATLSNFSDFAIACPTIYVAADPQIVRQLFINLMADAAPHTAAGGDISVTATADGALAELTLTVRPAAQNASATSDATCDQSQPDGFSIMLARTLADLSGAGLTIGISDGGDRYYRIVFAAANQQDFFA